ncbi:MAG: glycosyltransferase, partial [Thermoanaerobaculia bacterium]
MSILVILAIAVLVGLVLTSVQVELVHRLREGRFPFAPGPRERAASASRPAASMQRPMVSILKPLCGLEDSLEENLVSFTRLTELSYEVILSIEDPADPALAVAKRVCERFPAAPFSIVVGGVRKGLFSNPKVARLVAAVRRARGDIFFISDSNVRVAPDALAKTVALFEEPSVGCVSNLFLGTGARTFGARIESLHLLTFVVAGNALAAAGGVACVVGKSMAISRRAHDAIGGFAMAGNLLAEDQAIGLAVKAAGFAVVLSPVVVDNIVVHRTLERAIARQIRWGMIRHSFSAATFFGEFLLNPFALSLLAWGAAFVWAPEFAFTLGVLSALSLLIRVFQASRLGHLTGAPLEARTLLLM